MGIDGLLALLKPIIKKQHISKFRYQTIAVDASPWIYKGKYIASLQMAEKVQQHSFLFYILEMIEMLQFYQIKPIFVFDGKSLQAKGKTHQKRKKAKQQNQKKAEQHKKNQNHQEAKKFQARCINITEQSILLLMRLLKTKNIDFVVAPYQADSQIAKLYKLNLISAAITQDSDLVIYGVQVILKLKQNGQCDYLNINQKNKTITEDQVFNFLKMFCNFNQIKRTQSAILAGCDYVSSIKGIGIKKSIKLINDHQNIQKAIEKLKKNTKIVDKINLNYNESVMRAKLIFFFATVYNPKTNQLQFLNNEMITQICPKQMQIDQLIQIVGAHSNYNKQHYEGQINQKTGKIRQIQKLNFTELFCLDQTDAFVCFQKINKVQYKQKKLFNINSNILDKSINCQMKQQIIDEATLVCFQGNSYNEELMFYLQKQLNSQFFTLN